MTGVQTCALPISNKALGCWSNGARDEAQIVRVTHKRGPEQGYLLYFMGNENIRHSRKSSNLVVFNVCSARQEYGLKTPSIQPDMLYLKAQCFQSLETLVDVDKM